MDQISRHVRILSGRRAPPKIEPWINNLRASIPGAIAMPLLGAEPTVERPDKGSLLRFAGEALRWYSRCGPPADAPAPRITCGSPPTGSRCEPPPPGGVARRLRH